MGRRLKDFLRQRDERAQRKIVQKPFNYVPVLRHSKDAFWQNNAEAATRFAISHPAMGTILVGMATPLQFEDALAAVRKGPPPREALDRLATLQQGFAGEAR